MVTFSPTSLPFSSSCTWLFSSVTCPSSCSFSCIRSFLSCWLSSSWFYRGQDEKLGSACEAPIPRSCPHHSADACQGGEVTSVQAIKGRVREAWCATKSCPPPITHGLPELSTAHPSSLFPLRSCPFFAQQWQELLTWQKSFSIHTDKRDGSPNFTLFVLESDRCGFKSPV